MRAVLLKRARRLVGRRVRSAPMKEAMKRARRDLAVNYLRRITSASDPHDLPDQVLLSFSLPVSHPGPESDSDHQIR